MVAAPKTASVPALERALAILEKLARSKQGLTLSQLSRYLQLPKSSVHCLLLTFERCGYLNRDPDSGRYRAGQRISSLARTALGNVALRDTAAPFLRQLMQRTALTVHLAALDHGEAILIAKFTPAGPCRINSWLGKHMDLHCTSLGKALAAHLDEQLLDEQVRIHGLLRHNDNTIWSPKKLKEELALVRRRGYAIDDEEEELGARCVGAPILTAAGEPVAAISVSGATSEIDAADWTRLGTEVLTTARAISSRLVHWEEGTHGDPAVPQLSPAALSARLGSLS